jgi:hypothetical protein
MFLSLSLLCPLHTICSLENTPSVTNDDCKNSDTSTSSLIINWSAVNARKGRRNGLCQEASASETDRNASLFTRIQRGLQEEDKFNIGARCLADNKLSKQRLLFRIGLLECFPPVSVMDRNLQKTIGADRIPQFGEITIVSHSLTQSEYESLLRDFPKRALSQFDLDQYGPHDTTKAKSKATCLLCEIYRTINNVDSAGAKTFTHSSLTKLAEHVQNCPRHNKAIRWLADDPKTTPTSKGSILRYFSTASRFPPTPATPNSVSVSETCKPVQRQLQFQKPESSEVPCNHLWDREFLPIHRVGRSYGIPSGKIEYKSSEFKCECCSDYKTWKTKHADRLDLLKNYCRSKALATYQHGIFTPYGHKLAVTGSIKHRDCLGSAAASGSHPGVCARCWDLRTSPAITHPLATAQTAEATGKVLGPGQRGFRLQDASPDQLRAALANQQAENKQLATQLKKATSTKQDLERRLQKAVDDDKPEDFASAVHKIFELPLVDQQEMSNISGELIKNVLLYSKTSPNRHSFSRIIWHVSSLFKHRLGSANYELLQQMLCLPSDRSLSRHEPLSNPIEFGYNNQVLTTLRENDRILLTCDSGRCLRRVCAVKKHNADWKLIGTCADLTPFRALSRPVGEFKASSMYLEFPEAGGDEFGKLENLVKALTTTDPKTGHNRLASTYSLYCFSYLESRESTDVMACFPDPNSDFEAVHCVNIWLSIIRKAAANGHHIDGLANDNASRYLAAGKAIASPNQSVFPQLVYLGASEKQPYLAPFLDEIGPLVVYTDYLHTLRSAAKCLKYQSRDLCFWYGQRSNHHRNSSIVQNSFNCTIGHFMLLNEMLKADESAYGMEDLLLGAYYDQKTDSALRIFSEKSLSSLTRVPSAGGTCLYISMIWNICRPYIEGSSCGPPLLQIEYAQSGWSILLYWRAYLLKKRFRLHSGKGATKDPDKRGHFVTPAVCDSLILLANAVINSHLSYFLRFKDRGWVKSSLRNATSAPVENLIGALQGNSKELQPVEGVPTLDELSRRLTIVQEDARILSMLQIASNGTLKTVHRRRQQSEKNRLTKESALESAYSYPATYEEFQTQVQEARQRGVELAQRTIEKFVAPLAEYLAKETRKTGLGVQLSIWQEGLGLCEENHKNLTFFRGSLPANYYRDIASKASFECGKAGQRGRSASGTSEQHEAHRQEMKEMQEQEDEEEEEENQVLEKTEQKMLDRQVLQNMFQAEENKYYEILCHLNESCKKILHPQKFKNSASIWESLEKFREVCRTIVNQNHVPDAFEWPWREACCDEWSDIQSTSSSNYLPFDIPGHTGGARELAEHKWATLEALSDGNCMVNSVSILLTGSECIKNRLRVYLVLEMAVNFDTILAEEFVRTFWYVHGTPGEWSLEDRSRKHFKSTENEENLYACFAENLRAASNTWLNTKTGRRKYDWLNVAHLSVMPRVVKRDIVSVYPHLDSLVARSRPLVYNRRFAAPEPASPTVLLLMWTSSIITEALVKGIEVATETDKCQLSKDVNMARCFPNHFEPVIQQAPCSCVQEKVDQPPEVKTTFEELHSATVRRKKRRLTTKVKEPDTVVKMGSKPKEPHSENEKVVPLIIIDPMDVDEEQESEDKHREEQELGKDWKTNTPCANTPCANTKQLQAHDITVTKVIPKKRSRIASPGTARTTRAYPLYVQRSCREGKVEIIHVRRALKLIQGLPEFISKDRSKRYIVSKTLPGNKAPDPAHLLRLNCYYLFATSHSSSANDRRLGICLEIEKDGKKELSTDLPCAGVVTVGYLQAKDKSKGWYERELMLVTRVHGRALRADVATTTETRDTVELHNQPLLNLSENSQHQHEDAPSEPLKAAKDTELPQDYYNVEEICGKRINPETACLEFRVKWEGYDKPTWEPFSSLKRDVLELVVDYEKQQQHGAAKNAQRSVPARKAKELLEKEKYKNSMFLEDDG